MAAASTAKSVDTTAPAAQRTPKSLRGQNKPKCIQCGNVARSRCPYMSCQNCCAKAQNPCHIHVLKANATSDKTPTPSIPLFDAQKTEVTPPGTSQRVHSVRQHYLKNLTQFNNVQSVRARKPLTIKKLQQSDTDGDIIEANDEKEIERSTKKLRAERTSSFGDLIERLNKVRNEDDLKSCVEMKSQLCNRQQIGSRNIRNENVDKYKEQPTVGNDLSSQKQTEYSFPKFCTTTVIDEETLKSIDAHFSSLEQNMIYDFVAKKFRLLELNVAQQNNDMHAQFGQTNSSGLGSPVNDIHHHGRTALSYDRAPQGNAVSWCPSIFSLPCKLWKDHLLGVCPAHSLVTFGFGGKLLVMKDTSFQNLSFGNQIRHYTYVQSCFFGSLFVLFYIC
ncbi:hypothetical protein ACFE04_012906 [Oxalis oulophora]